MVNKRICSLETEYALISDLLNDKKYSRDNLAALIEQSILSTYDWARCNSFGRRSSVRAGDGIVEIREGHFIQNGSRVYYDAGHFEWSNPETLDPYHALLYDKAAERTLAETAAAVNKNLQLLHPGSSLALVKNNIDYYSDATYGCHENYSLLRFDNQGIDPFSRLADDFVPFLVTRQIFCGAGRIGARSVDANQPIAFQLSQRADFVKRVESTHTREERGLLNLRDEPLADVHRWRRLHLIVGDSNISEFATYLKIGVTSLVLDLFEANSIRGCWALQDPVHALHLVARDWQSGQLALRNGSKMSALAIQRAYHQMAGRWVSQQPAQDWRHKILQDWGQTLDDLEKQHPRITERLDWAIKNHYFFQRTLRAAQTDWSEMGCWDFIIAKTNHVALPAELVQEPLCWLEQNFVKTEVRQLKAYAQKHRLDWRLYAERRQLYHRLREIDVRYHDIHPATGLYRLLEKRNDIIQRLIPEDAIAQAQQQPPMTTRAWQRGQIIGLARKTNVDVELDWDKVRLTEIDQVLPMADPFIAEPLDLTPMLNQQATPQPIPATAHRDKIMIKVLSVENLRQDN